ncbi:hypothetical protein JOQ06_022357 [Pogonophryne albipinna]|uniref:Uncharacterized protein n=1 Tax=Pogonophryne albipinna TaxID=1090488 RepID=A0AAD6F5H3_9TELE|nr:hypothetical protein JOQ06_022357 [Pogonophryne albipinna]
MANYRTKLRGYGVPEVMCNALKRKRPADQKSAKNVKKPRKAELNYLPPYPAGEDEESQEQERIQLLSEVMKRDNNKLIKDKMAKTFSHRRNKIINQSPSIEDIKARWPALFEASHIQDEFQRITMAPSNPSIDMSRGLVIRCLMVYLGESTDQLLKEYDVS